MFLPTLTAPNQMLSQIQFQARATSYVIHNTQGPCGLPQHDRQLSVNIILEMNFRLLCHKSKRKSLLGQGPRAPFGLLHDRHRIQTSNLTRKSEAVVFSALQYKSVQNRHSALTFHLRANSVKLCTASNGGKAGAPDWIRTSDLCLRRAALYPAELRVPMPWRRCALVTRGDALSKTISLLPVNNGVIELAWHNCVAPLSRVWPCRFNPPERVRA